MVSVVMPIWFPPGDFEVLSVTGAAIDSLGPDVQKILVDNGSAESSGWIKQNADIYLRYSKNHGYTKATNDGIMLAEGDLIALVNNDLKVSPDWTEVAREVLADPNVATVHPKMVDYDAPFSLGNTVATDQERLCTNSFTVTTRRFLNEMRDKEWNNQPYPGLFDENYGIGGGADDWDFAWRIHQLGYQRAYTDRFVIQHKHSFSLKKLGDEREKIVAQNNEYFTSKWGKSKEELFREKGLI